MDLQDDESDYTGNNDLKCQKFGLWLEIRFNSYV